jgi:CheY-like chemotaxis protein
MPGSYIKADRSSFITSSGDKAELHKARYAKYINPMPGGSLRGRILVMDDEDFILDMMDKMLKSMGYDAVLAKNGDEAVSLYKAARENGEPFNCVILDLSISESMGGKEVMDILKDYDSGVKAVISSGYPDDPVVMNFREYGFSGAVLNPYSYDHLNGILDSLVSGS